MRIAALAMRTQSVIVRGGRPRRAAGGTSLGRLTNARRSRSTRRGCTGGVGHAHPERHREWQHRVATGASFTNLNRSPTSEESKHGQSGAAQVVAGSFRGRRRRKMGPEKAGKCAPQRWPRARRTSLRGKRPRRAAAGASLGRVTNARGGRSTSRGGLHVRRIFCSGSSMRDEQSESLGRCP